MTDWVSLGVLASFVPRDVVDEVIEETGRQAKRSGGKLPPHVMVYFVMAMALYADEDYEEIAARLSQTLESWGCWADSWVVPTSGGITQARKRLGVEPVEELFSQVAVPVADELTPGAFLGDRRLMAIDGFEWDTPATGDNGAAFGYSGAGGEQTAAFPKVRVVTISECGSHAMVAAQMGGTAGKGSGERALAGRLWPLLEPGWLLLADRNFFSWADWCTAADTGADLLWRVRADLRLPVLEYLSDGSCLSVLIKPGLGRGEDARERLIESARTGDLDPDRARLVRVIEYAVPDRGGNSEVIILVTTLTDLREAPAAALAEAYHQRWEQETANRQLKTYLRGPGRVLRSKTPDMVRQEIYGFLLTHYAISALICRAATEAGLDPDRVKFKRTLRIIRRRATGPAFPP